MSPPSRTEEAPAARTPGPERHPVACEAVRASAAAAREHLGSRLRAVYAVGSLGYGGFVPGWSDVDVDLVVEPTSPEDERANAVTAVLVRDQLHAEGFTYVDVKCYSPRVLELAPEVYEYGIRNRLVMLRESGQLVEGTPIRDQVPDPGIAALRREGVEVARRMTGRGDDWWHSRPIDDLAALFALPMRLVITSETGSVVGKLPALQRTLEEWDAAWPAAAWPWVAWATLCRSQPAARLLPDAALPAGADAARALLAAILPRLEAHAAADDPA